MMPGLVDVKPRKWKSAIPCTWPAIALTTHVEDRPARTAQLFF